MVLRFGYISRGRSGDQIVELSVLTSPCVHAYRIQRQIQIDLSILDRAASGLLMSGLARVTIRLM